MGELYQFRPYIRKAYEEAVIPFAVYQYCNGKIHVLFVTRGLCELTRMSREELMDRLENDMYANVHPQDAYVIAQASLRFATEGGEYDVVYREKFSFSEEYQVLHAVGAHVRTPEGTVLGVVRYNNITRAITSTENVKKVFNSSLEDFYNLDPQATCIVTRDRSQVLYANIAFTQILPPVKGYDSGVNFWEYFFGKKSGGKEGYFRSVCGKGPQIATEIAAGRPIVLNVREAVWAGEEAFVIRADELDNVYIDRLTGLVNQAYFELKAGERIAILRGSGEIPVCLFYDINEMKLYNAKNGFQDGDELLRRVGEVLQQVYGDALIARLSDDHYAIVTSENGLEDKMMSAAPMAAQLDRVVKIVIKAGVRRILPDEEIDISMILDQAKTACDLIHGDVTRSYQYYDAEIERTLQDRKYIVDHIDDAIANGEIEVFYQPQIRTLSRELCGFEALARWHSAELGFLPPYRFIPALERSHLIHRLDCEVIRQICCRYQATVREGGTPVPVSFNLSRLDFQMCDMFRFILETTDQYGVPHEMLHVEITETLLASNDEIIREAIQKFHGAGFQVRMDDFGSGYSSLNALKDYDFDQLKIDMVFLSKFNERSRRIIESIVQMAKYIGIHTLAEGVETEEQFEFLNRIGCEEVQGYYFGRPMPYEEIMEHLRELGIGPESREDAEYLTGAGLRMVHVEEAYAVMEDDGTRFRYVTMNEEYLAVLRKMGENSIDEVLARINRYTHTFREQIRKAEENGGKTNFTFRYREYYLGIGLQILNRRKNKTLVKLTMSDTVFGTVTRDVVNVEEGSR